MSATQSQLKLIDRLQDLGATIPCLTDGGIPDFSMRDSVEQADRYIKQWQHLLPSRSPVSLLSASEWGGVLNA